MPDHKFRAVLESISSAETVPDPLELAAFAKNDLGMAQRLRSRFGEHLLYTEEFGWAAWNGSRWATGKDGDILANKLAHKTAVSLDEEFEAWEAEQLALKAKLESSGKASEWDQKAFQSSRAEWQRFKKDAGNVGRTAATLSQAKWYLSADLNTFDPAPFRINAENGTVEVEHINEPCFVSHDTSGQVEGWVRKSEVGVAQATQVGRWSIRYLGECMYEVGHLGSGMDVAEPVDLSQIKRGISRNGSRLTNPIDFLHVRLVAHDPRHRITRITNCTYDPSAKAPRFRAHLKKVLPDPDDRSFFKRAMGYGMTASTDEQCFLFIQGKGGDGKTTTMQAIRFAMGDYAAVSNPRSWLEMRQRAGAEASPDIADMAGDTRLLTCEEPPKGARVDEALLKGASGGDPLKARQLHRPFFTFKPKFLLVMAFNDLPRITGADDGFWRRMRLIRFRHQFTTEEIREAGDILQSFRDEAPGILNWLIEGIAEWKRKGLEPHPAMATDIQQYRSGSDVVGEWIADRLEFDETARTSVADLKLDFDAYNKAQGYGDREIIGIKRFSQELDNRQIHGRKSGSTRFRSGVRLRPIID